MVRVYGLPSGTLLHEFRRGTSACTVHGMAFSVDEKMLAVSSDRVTVHLFRLDDPAAAAAAAAGQADAADAASAGGITSWASSFLSSVVRGFLFFFGLLVN